MEEDAKKDLMGLIIILIVIGFIWYFTGGPERISKESPFVIPPASTSGTKINNRGEKETPNDNKNISDKSDLKNFVELRKGRAKERDPEREYIEIRISKNSTEKISISNWTLKNSKGFNMKIGDAVYLPSPTVSNTKLPISVDPGGRIIIATSNSPAGYSFRLNKCTGYFEQSNNFYPSLPKNCPYPRDEELPNNLDDDCLDYIDRLSRCKAQLNSIPITLNNICHDYINKKVNYGSCIKTHKNDLDFYNNEWRVYLNRNEELWKQKRETIELFDSSGKLIDSLSY